MPLFNASEQSSNTLITSSTVTESQGSGIGTTSGTSILAANSARKGAIIFNSSNANLYIGFSNSMSNSANYAVMIPPNSFYEFPFNYTGAIYAASTTPSVGGIYVSEFS